MVRALTAAEEGELGPGSDGGQRRALSEGCRVRWVLARSLPHRWLHWTWGGGCRGLGPNLGGAVRARTQAAAVGKETRG